MRTRKKSEVKEEITPLSNFFKFNNPETASAILQTISQYEGVLLPGMDKYINNAHAKTSGQLLYDAKYLIKEFWRRHENLSLSEIKGLFSLGMECLSDEIIKKGDAFIEALKKRELKR